MRSGRSTGPRRSKRSGSRPVPRGSSIAEPRTRPTRRSKGSARAFGTRMLPRVRGSDWRRLRATLVRPLEHDSTRTVDRLSEANGLGRGHAGRPLGQHQALDDLPEQGALVDLGVTVEELALLGGDGDVLPHHALDGHLRLRARRHVPPIPLHVYVRIVDKVVPQNRKRSGLRGPGPKPGCERARTLAAERRIAPTVGARGRPDSSPRDPDSSLTRPPLGPPPGGPNAAASATGGDSPPVDDGRRPRPPARGRPRLTLGRAGSRRSNSPGPLSILGPRPLGVPCVRAHGSAAQRPWRRSSARCPRRPSSGLRNASPRASSRRGKPTHLAPGSAGTVGSTGLFPPAPRSPERRPDTSGRTGRGNRHRSGCRPRTDRQASPRRFARTVVEPGVAEAWDPGARRTPRRLDGRLPRQRPIAPPPSRPAGRLRSCNGSGDTAATGRCRSA